MKSAIAFLLAAMVGCSGLAAGRSLQFAPVGNGLTLPYYVSVPPGPDPASVTSILIAVHGYTRDANRTFDAAVALR